MTTTPRPRPEYAKRSDETWAEWVERIPPMPDHLRQQIAKDLRNGQTRPRKAS